MEDKLLQFEYIMIISFDHLTFTLSVVPKISSQQAQIYITLKHDYIASTCAS